MDVKIAITRSSRGVGIYHEKIGVITDHQGDSVAFNGSLNETTSAMLDNFESIEVFRSWEPADGPRVTRISERFELLWSNQTPQLEVIEFPEMARERLISLGSSTRRAVGVTGTQAPVLTSRGWPEVPAELKLREYQREAISKWLAAGGRGIFQMATGTGKTITALSALARAGQKLRVANSPLVSVIVVPLLGLMDQWVKDLRRFGVAPIQCRDSWQDWEPEVSDSVAALTAGSDQHISIIVTNKTFATERFQGVLARISAPLMLIGDEIHNLGSSQLRSCLPDNAHLRLGLSATPERYLDPDGTDSLVRYFGDILIELGIREAIEIGALTRYRYFPVLVPLESDESEDYVRITKRIGQLYGQLQAGGDVQSSLDALLLKRSKILGQAKGKLPALRTEISQRRDQFFQLVYCGEGSRPGFSASASRQIDEALSLIGAELKIPAHTYTSRESTAERREILRDFASGEGIQVLVSMRCLDEGVDIPDARVAYMLASSKNPRQFIQRRGRVLRKSPGKTSADMIDFVVTPPRDPDLFEVEKNLFRGELARCLEFARYADNGGWALSELRELREYYDLMGI
ncbi:DEAD/DEAH box helicase family protein [Kitasatospora cystarginea]